MHAESRTPAGSAQAYGVLGGLPPFSEGELLTVGSRASRSSPKIRLAGRIWRLQCQRILGGAGLPIHPEAGRASSPADLRGGVDRSAHEARHRIRSGESL